MEKTTKKTLLIYPNYPDTFWSFKYALGFISKKAMHPPLGLITVAAMLPDNWKKKLVDMNVSSLSEADLLWADYVFISAMAIQKKSAQKIIQKCHELGKKVIAGGPLFTANHESFKNVDHLILNEAEITLTSFLKDLEKGCPKKIYRTEKFSNIEQAPLPLYELLDMKKYVSISIQYSRGCPFNCEFCDITTLFGRGVRTKNKRQVMAELNKLHSLGWRGSIFFVDDNFIGNKIKLKKEILPALIKWQKEKRQPFTFSTEASINLADDDELMEMMAQAGFINVFIGIETPNEESLVECGKFQNKNRSLTESIRKIQLSGLEVTGGFIVGFDSDAPSIFQRQIKFIQESRIITAMVGLLNAPRGSRLYKRMLNEGRLIKNVTGDNTDFSTNLIPKMGLDKLKNGYQKVIEGIYSPGPYYKRVKNFLKECNPKRKRNFHMHFGYIKYHFGYAGALFKAIVILGLKDKARLHFWKLLFWSIFKGPKTFILALSYSVYGFHFRKIFNLK